MTWSSDSAQPQPLRTPNSGRVATPSRAASWLPDEIQAPPPLPSIAPDSFVSADVEAARRRMLDATYAEAYEEGRLAGEIAERVRLDSAVRTVEDLLAVLQERESRWTELIEENICAIAVGLARLLVEREVSVDSTVTTDLVRRALAEFPIDQPLSIRVNPTDLASITANAVTHPQSSPSAGRPDTHWIPDPRISPGGCIVEGRDRIVDGRVDAALERVYRRLTYTGA
jgi:flagellar biosynthesis/type III secretory pathway protein FliH